MNDGQMAWLVILCIAIVFYAFREQNLKYKDRVRGRSIDKDYAEINKDRLALDKDRLALDKDRLKMDDKTRADQK